jgi:hypothetical protein
MANLAAGVTAPTGASSAQAEGRAVALHVTKALAMVTLLCFGGARKWAAIGFMAWDILEWTPGGGVMPVPGCLQL